jgi:GNAT superfamily N-acetyltransferase
MLPGESASSLRILEPDAAGEEAALTIEQLRRPPRPAEIEALAELLVDAVRGGASVCFLAPLSRSRAIAWWRQTLLQSDPRAFFLVARVGGTIIGTVQLQPAWAPNAQHRGTVAKLLVHSQNRRRGVGRALMTGLEQRAAQAGFSLLTLDTRRGDTGEHLYRSMGWTCAGVIPGYAVNSDGGPADNVVFYKQIA